MDDLPDILVTLTIVVVILAVGTLAVSTVVSTGDYNDQVQTAAELDGTQWTRLDDTVGVNENVYDSRGFAIQLTGADNSKFSSSETFDVASDETFTASVWLQRNNDTDMTAYTLDSNLVVGYNASRGNYTAWYYDEGDRDSYQVEVSEQSGNNLENVVVVRDNETLTIYSNLTHGTRADLSVASTEPAPTNSTNWNGTVEELRLSDVAWNSSVRSNHYNNPIDPLSVAQTARIMFDEPYRDYQLLFYADGRINQNNVNFVQGLPGQELDSTEVLLQQSDYKFRQEGPQIRAVSGGEVDGAPVAYVDYTSKGIAGVLVDDWNNAVGLAGVAIILLPLGAIIVYLYGIREQR